MSSGFKDKGEGDWREEERRSTSVCLPEPGQGLVSGVC